MFTEESSIFGGGQGFALDQPASTSQEQVCAYILRRPHGEYTEDDIRTVIVPAYFSQCEAVGIQPVLAIAQMIHETGNLTSFWAARPQRNPAGIGVNGQKQPTEPADKTNWAFNTQRGQWEYGVSFASWQNDAIPAHIGRLLAYFLPKGAESDVQRTAIERGLRYRALQDKMRGSARTLRQIGRAHNPTGQGWASPGTDYGARIAATASRILSAER
ncbi:MAG: hypothetical protein RLZZ387_4231 [Chloroflexota bacterium]|jgi:hypothetical protein